MTLPLAQLSDEEVVEAYEQSTLDYSYYGNEKELVKLRALRAELLRRLKATRPETGKE